MLEAIQGLRPDRLGFILGDGRQEHFRADDFWYYYQRLKRQFEAFQASLVPSGTARSRRRSRLRPVDRRRRAAPGGARRPEPRRGDRRGARCVRLREAGIETVAQLGQLDETASVAGITAASLARLREQAAMQLKTREGDAIRLEVPRAGSRGPASRARAAPAAVAARCVLRHRGLPLRPRRAGVPPRRHHDRGRGPPASTTGGRTTSRGEARLRGSSSTGPGRGGSRTRRCTSTTTPRTSAPRSAAWASSTPLASGRSTSSCGTTCWSTSTTVVRQGLVIGTPSYSLKDIEHLYMPAREGDVLSAGASVVEYQKWIDSGEPGDWEHSPDPQGDPRLQPRRLRLDGEAGGWLLERQQEAGVTWIPAADITAATVQREPTEAELLANRAAGDRPQTPRGERCPAPLPDAGLAAGIPPPRREADLVALLRAAGDGGAGADRRSRLSRRPRQDRQRPRGRSSGRPAWSIASTPTRTPSCTRRQVRLSPCRRTSRSSWSRSTGSGASPRSRSVQARSCRVGCRSFPTTMSAPR